MDDWLGNRPSDDWLGALGLNDQQMKAVTSSKDQRALQILAGPGSGKTKTLTARVAWLAKTMAVNPEDIVVITFANKAAREMKERLFKLIGPELLGKLVIGTFHATCVRYLRKHGSLINVKSNFDIADRDHTAAILKKLIGDYKKVFERREVQPPTPKEAQDIISRAKSENQSPDKFKLEADKGRNATYQVMSDVYFDSEVYRCFTTADQTALVRTNAFDFDDLLLKGLELFSKHWRILANVRCVLVDEFQDTNHVQYEILQKLAKKAALTVVGDPDQSIYAFRAAQSECIDWMQKDFPTGQVFLEQNYRSTGGILAAAVGIISQDKQRIKRNLFTSESHGIPVCVKDQSTARTEAQYIAHEIKRLRAQTGNQLDYDDFAVLLRFNALSRTLEGALQMAGIPHRVLGGSKFFDRIEVKDIVAYLQLANNPEYEPAFDRVINVPKRAMGPAVLGQLKTAAEKAGTSSMVVLSKCLQGEACGGLSLKPGQRKNMQGFVSVVAIIKNAANQNTPIAKLIKQIMRLVGYVEHLERTTPTDIENRLENLKELQAFAVQIEKDTAPPGQDEDELDLSQPDFSLSQTQASVASESQEQDEDEVELVPPANSDLDTLTQDRTALEETKLQTFLTSCMLSTDTQIDSPENSQPKVTISTVHSAKGLEWPCVFVMSCEEGVYPFYRAKTEKEISEERRLLYVAMTRAQISLQLTWSHERQVGSRLLQPDISPFLSKLSPDLFSKHLSGLSNEDRQTISKLLDRRPVADELVEAEVAAFNSTLAQSGIGHSSQSNDASTSRGGYGQYTGSSYSSASTNPYQGGSYPGWQSKGYRLGNAVQPKHSGTASQPSQSAGFSSARSLLSQGTASTAVPSRTPSQQSTASSKPTPSLAGFQSASQDDIVLMRDLGKDIIKDEEIFQVQDKTKHDNVQRAGKSNFRGDQPSSSAGSSKRGTSESMLNSARKRLKE